MKRKYVVLDKKIKKQKLLLMTVFCCTLLLFTGCKNEDGTSSNVNTENNQEVEDKVEENDSNEVTIPNESNEEAPSLIESQSEKEVTPSVNESQREESNLFSELSGYQFVFSSGAGAWATMLNIYEDGTFQGEYHDSDMGTTGEGYPLGVVYSSTFEGKFTEPTKVNDYTYSMAIEYINLAKEVGTEEVIDEIKYIYSEPYGLNDAKEIYIYTPEAPIKELPEGFRSWVGYIDLNEVKEENLGFYGLYNVAAESGFSSYELYDMQ